MDDAMIDLMAGDTMLRRRLEAYADARLSPDLAASSRIRARVLAVAHRQATLAHADAALAVVPRTGVLPASVRMSTARATHKPWRRASAVLVAAGLALTLVVGTTFAAQPGGPMYGARLWIETLQLPGDPSARALAELDRLTQRLDEVAAANRAGDSAAAAAALAAYATILDEASSRALLDADVVASAALEAGVARNIEVLQGLVETLPEQAAAAVGLALERAIDRSGETVDSIGGPGVGTPSGGNEPDDGNGGGAPVTATDTPAATATPTPKPTRDPVVKPTKEPTPAPVAEPTRTPRPEKTPPAKGKPSDPPGADQDGDDGD